MTAPADGPALRHAPGLRLRPVPELSTCLAFTPAPPRLHTLNPSAWLIMELCRTILPPATLEARYLSRTTPPLSADDAAAQLRAGLGHLRAAGLLEPAEPPAPAAEETP